jgi:hypothetical protein
VGWQQQERPPQFPQMQDVLGTLSIWRKAVETSRRQTPKGFGGAGILELIEDFNTNTHRAALRSLR